MIIARIILVLCFMKIQNTYKNIIYFEDQFIMYNLKQLLSLKDHIVQYSHKGVDGNLIFNIFGEVQIPEGC